MGKCGGGVRKCVGEVSRSSLWGRFGRVYGVTVDAVEKWGNVCWNVGRCGESPHTLLHLPHTSPHSPDTSLHTFPHSPCIFPHFPTLLTPFLTSPHTPSHTYLTGYLPQHFPTLPHSPHMFFNTIPYFIIYPIAKFLTFLIYLPN